MIIGHMQLLLLILMTGLVAYRFTLGMEADELRLRPDIGIWQTNGRKEIQADIAYAATGSAGTMAVLADGIGRENTGKVCAQLAVDSVFDQFEPYRTLDNMEYFFKSAFAEANSRIRKTIGDRKGGCSLAAVFMNQTHLYYAVAGDIRIALVRNKEMIPLSRGHTLDVLAVQAYQDGRISRQEAVWSMDEKRIWNHLGREGFHEIEICEKPIRIKAGDRVLMISKGIFEEMSWGELEDMTQDTEAAATTARRMVQAAENKANPDMDNGSVLLLRV